MPLSGIRPADRAHIEELLADNKWSLPGDHPIAALDGLALGDYQVTALLGPKNAVGRATSSCIWLTHRAAEQTSHWDLGLHNAGSHLLTASETAPV